MSDSPSARVYTLPILRLTAASDAPGQDFLPVQHHHGGRAVKYWRKRKSGSSGRWTSFPKFPLVLNADGSPWDVACLYLLERALLKPLQIASLASIAQGLKDYKIFLDALSLTWNDFSSVDKYCRPTYLYKTHLEALIAGGGIKDTTAGRRMSAVIAFYRYAQADPRMQFQPVNAPWNESSFSLNYRVLISSET